MKRVLSLMIGLIMMVALTGCGSSLFNSNITGAAQNQGMNYAGLFTPNPEAEMMLETAFTETDVPWKEGRVKAINDARSTINGIASYLKTKIELDGTISYYSYKSAFENIQFQYNLLQTELDARVEIEGTISDKDKIIYYYVKRDINLMIDLQRKKINATEKSIEAQADSDSIEEMKSIYSAIQPLVGMVI